MYTKLTLNIEQSVIESAKVYARSTQRSLSKLVEDYLTTLTRSVAPETRARPELGPITREIAGIIRLDGESPDKESDYKQTLTAALLEKYL